MKNNEVCTLPLSSSFVLLLQHFLSSRPPPPTPKRQTCLFLTLSSFCTAQVLAGSLVGWGQGVEGSPRCQKISQVKCLRRQVWLNHRRLTKKSWHLLNGCEHRVELGRSSILCFSSLPSSLERSQERLGELL